MRSSSWKHHLNRHVICAALFAVTGLTATASRAATIDLVPVRDNTLFEDATGAVSNGAGAHCFAGVNFNSGPRRALFWFDLSAIPAGSIVQSAELRLTLNRAASASGSRPITLHRMTASWGEGTSNADAVGGGGGGTSSTTGDATWVHRFFPSVAWAQPGGDFDNPVLATTNVPETLGQYIWGSTSAMVAAVQSWLNTPATNFGFLLQGDESSVPSARRFYTRETTTDANRPHLLVTYGALSASEMPPASALRFEPAAPNPFNPSTTLTWNAPSAGRARITVWDARGGLVAQPLAGVRPAGLQSLVWQAKDVHGRTLPSGVYVVRLEQGGDTRSQRVVLVR